MNNNSIFLNLPSDWKDETIYTFTGPVESGIPHNLIVSVEPSLSGKQSSEEFADRQRAELDAEMPGFEEIAFSYKALKNGLDGKELVYQFRPDMLYDKNADGGILGRFILYQLSTISIYQSGEQE